MVEGQNGLTFQGPFVLVERFQIRKQMSELSTLQYNVVVVSSLSSFDVD